MTLSIRHGTAVLLLVCAVATPSAAQPNADRFELHVGAGFADMRLSVEQAPPSGRTLDIGGAFWWGEHWGGAARSFGIVAPDIYNRVYDAGWRTHVDNGKGRYTVVTVRYRRFTSNGIELSAGIGIFGGSYESTHLLRSPRGPERAVVYLVQGGGVACELLVGYKLFRHLGVKAGLAGGGPWEAHYVQPFAVSVFSF